MSGLVQGIAGLAWGGVNGAVAASCGMLAGKIVERLGLPERCGWLLGTAGAGAWAVTLAKHSSVFFAFYRVGAPISVVVFSARLGVFPSQNRPNEKLWFRKGAYYGYIVIATAIILLPPAWLPAAVSIASIVAHVIAYRSSL